MHSWSEVARIRQSAAFLYNPKEYLHSLRDARFPCVAPGAIFNIGPATAIPAVPTPTALIYDIYIS